MASFNKGNRRCSNSNGGGKGALVVAAAFLSVSEEASNRQPQIRNQGAEAEEALQRDCWWWLLISAFSVEQRSIGRLLPAAPCNWMLFCVLMMISALQFWCEQQRDFRLACFAVSPAPLPIVQLEVEKIFPDVQHGLLPVKPNCPRRSKEAIVFHLP